MYNRVFLIGRLTRDPEVRYLPSGVAVTSFDVAVNERYRDRNQELREETIYIRVETFQRLAETCAQFLKKGRRVFVEGRFRIDNWEGRDGVKRSQIVVRGLQVKFIDSRSAEGAGQPAAAARPAQKPPQPAAPEPAAEKPAAAPPEEELPAYDINEEPFAAGGDEGTEETTDDDLPF